MVALMSDELACVNTLNRFFRALDDCAYEACTDLLSENGSWIRQGKPLVGRTALLETLRARPAGLLTRHIISNMIVTRISQTTYDATFYSTVFAHQTKTGDEIPPVSLPAAISVFKAKLKYENDQWLICALQSSPTFKQRD